MRQRVIVGTKLAETVARGAFVLVCTYRLPLIETGQFGLAVTLISLAAFALGYERHIELLRHSAQSSAAVVRRRLADMVRFLVPQALLVLPLLALLLLLLVDATATLIALCLMIAVGEHASNQGYYAALAEKSHYSLLALSAVKHLLLAAAMVAAGVFAPQELRLDRVLEGWAAANAVFLAALAIDWQRGVAERDEQTPLPQPVRAQYAASRAHFALGLVAIAASQADRIATGTLLSPNDLGIYFRNVTIAGLVLQLFTIVSFNRVAPEIYAKVRAGELARARFVVRAEYLRFAAAMAASWVLGLLLYTTAAGDALTALNVEPSLLALLALMVLLRTGADYLGLLLLAQGRGGMLLRHQIVAVVAGTLALAAAAAAFGLCGAVAGTLITPLIYLVLNQASARRWP